MSEADLRALPWDGVVEVEQVFTYALPAYGDGSWSEIFTEMCSFPGEWEKVQTLASELAAALAGNPEATFDLPIVVGFTEPEDWDEEDEKELGPRPVQPSVHNGMHRLAACALVGAKWVKVTSDPYEVTHEELVQVKARLSTANPKVDLCDFAAEWLGSFRLNDSAWVESDGYVCVNGVYEWLFYCPHPQADNLTAALELRCRARQVNIEIIEAVQTNWAEREAQW